MTFTASLDKLAKGITFGVTFLFITVIAVLLFSFDMRYSFMSIFISIWLVVIYLIAFVLKPGNYIVTADKLVITRPWKNVTINKTDIESVRVIEPASLNGSIRMFGVGGLFGYYGKFSNRNFGSMTWYVTRRDKPVLITTIANKKIILSPDFPEEFAQSCNS